MEVVVGLIGVALGWLLGAVTDLLRERRDARMAGRLVLDELSRNLRFLEQVVKQDGEVSLDAPPRRSSWEGVGSSFLRVAKPELAKRVSAAYYGTETVWITVGYIIRARDNALESLRQLRDSIGGREDEAGPHVQDQLTLYTTGVNKLDTALREYAAEVKKRDFPFLEETVRLVDQSVYPDGKHQVAV